MTDGFYRFAPTQDFPDLERPLAPYRCTDTQPDEEAEAIEQFCYDERIGTVRSRIEERIAGMHLDKQTLFRRLGWPRSTGYDRLKHPETMPAEEAERLAAALQASPDYLRGDSRSPATRFGEIPPGVEEAYSTLGNEDRNLVDSLILRLAGWDAPGAGTDSAAIPF